MAAQVTPTPWCLVIGNVFRLTELLWKITTRRLVSHKLTNAAFQHFVYMTDNKSIKRITTFFFFWFLESKWRPDDYCTEGIPCLPEYTTFTPVMSQFWDFGRFALIQLKYCLPCLNGCITRKWSFSETERHLELSDINDRL